MTEEQINRVTKVLTLAVEALNTSKKFKVGEKELDSEALILSFVESATSPLNTGEKTEVGGDAGDVVAQAKKYMEKNKVSFKAALLAVSKDQKA